MVAAAMGVDAIPQASEPHRWQSVDLPGASARGLTDGGMAQQLAGNEHPVISYRQSPIAFPQVMHRFGVVDPRFRNQSHPGSRRLETGWGCRIGLARHGTGWNQVGFRRPNRR